MREILNESSHCMVLTPGKGHINIVRANDKNYAVGLHLYVWYDSPGFSLETNLTLNLSIWSCQLCEPGTAIP